MKLNYSSVVKGFVISLLMYQLPIQVAHGEAVESIKHLSGEITAIDVKEGILHFRINNAVDNREDIVYRINKNDTRVTDPLDQKFLSIDDLQAGQLVLIDVVRGKENRVIKRIVAEPYLEEGFQQVFGNVESINMNIGTLVIKERPWMYDLQKKEKLRFIFDPKNVIIMQDPNPQPVQIQIARGDLVRVVYAVKDDKNQVQSVTVYSPKTTRTVVTTTTTTTQ